MIKTYLSRALRPPVRFALTHLHRLRRERGYLDYELLVEQLRKTPRHQTTTATLHGQTFSIPDAASFLSAYREIFVRRAYAFESERNAPRILDLGANIGLSVLFFKALHPQAEVVALEPDPQIFAHLERNTRGLPGVTLLQQAAWTEATTLSFAPDGADAGRIDAGAGSMKVDAIDARTLFDGRPVDFLKIDIEGAEREVLPWLEPHLGEVRHVFLEHHSRQGEPQRLDEQLAILRRAGFRYFLHAPAAANAPMITRPSYAGFDLQVDVFAWRS